MENIYIEKLSYLIQNTFEPENIKLYNDTNFWFKSKIENGDLECLNFFLKCLNKNTPIEVVNYSIILLRSYKSIKHIQVLKQYIFKLVFGDLEFSNNKEIEIELVEILKTPPVELNDCIKLIKFLVTTPTEKMENGLLLYAIDILKAYIIHDNKQILNTMLTENNCNVLVKKTSEIIIQNISGGDGNEKDIDILFEFLSLIVDKTQISFINYGNFIEKCILKGTNLERDIVLDVLTKVLCKLRFTIKPNELTQIIERLKKGLSYKVYDEGIFLKFNLMLLNNLKLSKYFVNEVKQLLMDYYCTIRTTENELNFAIANPYDYYMLNLLGKESDLLVNFVCTLDKKYNESFFTFYDVKGVGAKNAVVLKLILPLLNLNKYKSQFQAFLIKKTIPILKNESLLKNLDTLTLLYQIKTSYLFSKKFPQDVNIGTFTAIVSGLVSVLELHGYKDTPCVTILYVIRHLTFYFECIPLDKLIGGNGNNNNNKQNLRKLFTKFIIWAFQGIRKAIIKVDYTKEILLMIYVFLKRYRTYIDPKINLIVKLCEVLRCFITFKNTNPATFKILFECICLEVKCLKGRFKLEEETNASVIVIENDLILLGDYLFKLMKDNPKESFLKNIQCYILQTLILITKYHFVKFEARPRIDLKTENKFFNFKVGACETILLQILIYYNTLVKINDNTKLKVKVKSLENGGEETHFFRTNISSKNLICKKVKASFFLQSFNFFFKLPNVYFPLIFLAIYAFRKDILGNDILENLVKKYFKGGENKKHLDKLQKYFDLYKKGEFQIINQNPQFYEDTEISFGFQIDDFIFLEEFESGIKELSIIDYI